MSEFTIGSVWVLDQIGNAAAVVVAGPFAAGSVSEVMVVPLYTGEERDFVWTDQDVLLRADETPFGQTRYAALWNARSVLTSDLTIGAGLLTPPATATLQDAYWIFLSDAPVHASSRLARPPKWWARRKVTRFRRAEVQRWQRLSERVIAATEAYDLDPVSPSLGASEHSTCVIREIMFEHGRERLFLSANELWWVLRAAYTIHDDLLLAPAVSALEPGRVMLRGIAPCHPDLRTYVPGPGPADRESRWSRRFEVPVMTEGIDGIGAGKPLAPEPTAA